LSTLTKVFVVLLVIFSVAFTTMTVAMVARTTNWRDLAVKYEERAKIADTTLRNLIAASAAEEAASRDAIQNHLARISEMEKKLQEGSADVARLRTEQAKLQADKSSADAMNRALVSQVELSREAESKVREQLNTVDRENIDLQQRNVDLNSRVNELTAQVSVLAEQRRQYEQQLNLLREENEKLSQGAQQPGRSRVMESPTGMALQNVRPLGGQAVANSAAIRGKILAVNGNLVTMSIGTSDGVRKDMRFVVHRDNDYVADVVVNAVEPDQSAGRIVGGSGGRQPQSGDLVTDMVSLGSSRR